VAELVSDLRRRGLLDQPYFHMVLLVNTRRGTVSGYPMTGAFAEDSVWFTTYRKSRKVAHLLADDRVCCVLVPPSTEPIQDPPLALSGHAALADGAGPFAQTTPGDAPLEVPSAVREKVVDRLRSGQRVVFRVPVESARVLSRPPDVGA
jgi:hypothetical protein